VIPPRARSGPVLAVALLSALLAGCSEALEQEAKERAEPRPAVPAGTSRNAEEPDPAAVEPARCPADVPGCRTASGRIIYVEAVDPDGDGDAHFVLASREGISAPGVSIIDVGRDLRPDPLPRVGDRISAAGPVYPGSYGQRQIQAVVLHTESAAG
jgi:hypothetical protein